jgi:hypothetical protein
VRKLLNPLTSKSVYADADGMWPAYESHEQAMHLLRRRMPFMNYMMFSNTPYWQTLTDLQSLFDWFHINPVLYATIMIKAREYANMRIKVVNRWKRDLVEEEGTRKEIPAKIYALFNKPNVLQSRWEFLMQRKIFEEVSGNSFTYGNFALGMKPSVKNIEALWNVWPSYMKFKLAGKYFEATQLNEVIKEWKFEIGNYKKEWEPHEILHKNKPNTNVNDGLIFGRSPIYSLVRAISNIDMAYESRNVMMRNRGMRVLLSSEKSDDSGKIPLDVAENDDMQKRIREYGLLESQSQFFFSPVPLKAVPIDQDVMKLGLFEEIATDAMVVCNAYGVPEILLKLYIKGATFENQEASVRRLYQGTLIPEAEDDMIAFNSFLGLDQTDWMIVPDFSHVAALQESEEKKAETEERRKKVAMEEVKNKLMTADEYRKLFGYGKMPEPKEDEETTEEDGNETETETGQGNDSEAEQE